jgi:hypothetical protein
MTPISFYVQIVKALDEIGALYMIVGAFGGSVFGIALPQMILTYWWICRKRIASPFRTNFLFHAIMLTQK